MRIVIDTSDFISAMIGKTHRVKLMEVLDNPNIEIFADENLLTELRDVAYREKFRKYISAADVALFIEVAIASFTLVTVDTVVNDSPDPKDNYLLSLAIDSQSEYLITGNKRDLLDLSPYRGIEIIRLQAFLDIIR